MRSRRCDAGSAFAAPPGDFSRICAQWPAKTGLAFVSLPSSSQSGFRDGAAGGSPLGDPLALHVSHLRQHREDQLTDTFPNAPQAVHLNRHAFLKQLADGSLNIEGVAAETVNRIDMQLVPLANVSE
jgi:hypothetical protein